MAQSLSAAYHGDPVKHILLMGERGIGKSSLLQFCELMAADDLPGETTDFDFLVVSVSLAGVSDMFEITRRVADHLKLALDTRNVASPGLRAIVDFLLNWEILGVHYHRPETPVSHNQALGTLVDKLAEVERLGFFQGVFITFDEADAPPPDAGLATWLKDFTERLQRQKVAKLLMLVAGQPILRAHLYDNHQSVLRIFKSMTLTPLADLERREILRTGMRLANATANQPRDMTDDAEDLLSDLSEGYPFFLQTYAYAAFDQAGTGPVDAEAVETAFPAATRDIGADFFDGVYKSAATSDNYKAVLRAMADHGTDWLTRQQITKAAEPVSPDNVANALRKMKTSDALEAHPDKPGLYRLPTNAFAAWLKTLDDV